MPNQKQRKTWREYSKKRRDSKLLQEFRERALRAPWLAYALTAVPKIIPWHESTANYRVLSGPNGGGKTTAAAADLVSYSMGYNPFRDEHYDTPNVCWGVCVEYTSAGRVMLRKLSEMLPRNRDGSRAWKYYKQEHLIVCPNGSEIMLKSQNEGESSLLAERCTAIWIDEAKGGDVGNENFGELQARGLPNQPLKMMFSLTPKVDIGIDWMRRKLWCEPGDTPHEDFIQGTFCHRFELSDCLEENGGFLNKESYDEKMRTIDPTEIEARAFGLWTPFLSRPVFNFKQMMDVLPRCPTGTKIQWHTYLSTRPKPEESGNGQGKLFVERSDQHSYIGSWDPAIGLGKSHDPNAFIVWDRADLTQVYHARSFDLSTRDFYRQYVQPACNYYGDSLLVIENNGEAGGAATEAARDYTNLYTQRTAGRLGAQSTDRIGWNTNDQSRSRMIDSLKRALKENVWTPSKELIEEMANVVAKRTGDKSKIQHADGFHDDLVMATGMALAVHYEEPIYVWPDFEKLRIKYGPSHPIYTNDIQVTELSGT